MSLQHTEVVICGGGPTGVVLSALLGQAGVDNVVLEREHAITSDPRGIALDEEGIRILQAIGVYDKVFTQIGMCTGKSRFIAGRTNDLYKRPLFSIDFGTSEGGTGHPGILFHKQPKLEEVIRDVINANPRCRLQTACKVVDIVEDESAVTVTYADEHGERREVRAGFLVGADGKTGYVRKQYLEARGISMDDCEGTKYNETWVALNWRIRLPTPDTHPHFPLWQKNYTPQQVYDTFFPQGFRFLCNPERPAICSRFGPQQDRLWRFEFLVHSNEDGHFMSTKEEVNKIVLPYLTHPGKKHGLAGTIQYPIDCIETLRARPFSFAARSCNKWAVDRVIIIGDAAHVFPPFGGQGIVSGFRDAIALAWRLQLLVNRPGLSHHDLLKAWYEERQQQLKRSLAATVHNGQHVNERNPIKLLVRDWWFWLLQLIPSQARKLEMGPRAFGMTRYAWAEGLGFLPSGGRTLPQVYAYVSTTNDVVFTDDLLFAGNKQRPFQIMALAHTLRQAAAQVETLSSLPESWLIHPGESTVLIHGEGFEHLPECQSQKRICIARTATADEFARSSLCKGRPEPRFYRASRIVEEFKLAKYLIVRPDRFVYAACVDESGLNRAMALLEIQFE